jgi:hypothetical protein
VWPLHQATIQRKAACACGGGCPRCESESVGEQVQAKFAISSPGDQFEQEADRIADQVMRMPSSDGHGFNAPADEAPATPPGLNKRILRQANDVAPQRKVVSNFTSRLGEGTPLDAESRRYFEPRFNRDFSSVRVHAGDTAADSADMVHARAYTVGHDVVFAAGQYSPDSAHGKRLLAHELTHVIQQTQAPTSRAERKLLRTNSKDAEVNPSDPAREIEISPLPATGDFTVFRSVGDTGEAGPAPAGGAPAGGAPAQPAARGFEIDVLASQPIEASVERAAARALGVDIRVRSMDDMINQVETRAGAGSCVRRLNIYNHANPHIQAISGGAKAKTPTGERTRTPVTGFSVDWLTANANQAALNRLRHSFCCDGQMNWWGCSTAGVTATGGTRTSAEQAEDAHRYTGEFGAWYHDVADAAAHGATSFAHIGTVNVQSWANSLCVPVVGATDFNSWRTVGDEVLRTVIHGGRQVRLGPQGDVGCGCDPAIGRISGSAQTSAQIQQRATELREQILRPIYERARSPLGTAQPALPESEAERTTRETGELAQTQASEQLGNTIRDAVLRAAGFAVGARPTTPDQALRVANLWGLTLDNIVAALPTLTTSLSGMLRGSHEEAGLDQQQRALETALTPAGREGFMAALTLVRRDRFWNDYLLRNTVFIFPDLTGANRYRGFTQVATHTTAGNRPQTVFVIHVSKDLLELRQSELVAANIVHELSHTAYRHNQIGDAMKTFETDLATLLVDHPKVVALRSAAADAAAVRSTHLARIRQMLYEVTGYGEEEIFVHLQQLTHQPSMTIDRATVRGSDFILSQVELFMRRLRRIGMPVGILNQVLGSIRRQAIELYDRRIAMAPAGSPDRRSLELSKEQALLIFQMALTESATPPTP